MVWKGCGGGCGGSGGCSGDGEMIVVVEALVLERWWCLVVLVLLLK